VGELLPSFSSQKTSGNDVVNLLFCFDHSVVSVVDFIELSMQVAIENLQPFYYFLQINIGIFCVEKQLFGIAELKIVGAIKGEEDGRLKVTILILEVLHVGGEHVGEISHYHWNILKCLMLGFGVHH
jgi:hypothetical protein